MPYKDKIIANLRTRMRLALKNKRKSGNSFDLLGCSSEHFLENT
jgi:hypothetical protein